MIKGEKQVLQEYADKLFEKQKELNPQTISKAYSEVIEIEGEYYTLYKPEWVEKPEGTEIIDVLPKIDEENE